MAADTAAGAIDMVRRTAVTAGANEARQLPPRGGEGPPLGRNIAPEQSLNGGEAAGGSMLVVLEGWWAVIGL